MSVLNTYCGFMQCPICKSDTNCTLSIFRETPFIDGRNYSDVCFCCASVPNTYEYDELTEQLDVYLNMSPLHINTIQQMISQGWSQHEANASLQAVKKLLNKPLEINNIGIFECLFGLEGISLLESNFQ